MSKLTNTGKSRPDLKVYQPAKTASEVNPLTNEPSFESLSEIEDASNHEKMISFLQHSPHHKGMGSLQSGMISGDSSPNVNRNNFARAANKLQVPHESHNTLRPVIKSEGHSYHFTAESIEDGLQPRVFSSFQAERGDDLLNSKRITSNNGEGSSKSAFSKTSVTNQKASPDVVQNLEGDIQIGNMETENEKPEGKDVNKKQGQLIEKLKLALAGGGDGKVGWEIFVDKGAQAKARIGEAFLNAKDHALFDATAKELQVINDKTWVQKSKRFSRKNFRKKHEVPSLRKILEKHGIISKKALDRKSLKRILNKLTRRKSKRNYMKGKNEYRY